MVLNYISITPQQKYSISEELTDQNLGILLLSILSQLRDLFSSTSPSENSMKAIQFRVYNIYILITYNHNAWVGTYILQFLISWFLPYLLIYRYKIPIIVNYIYILLFFRMIKNFSASTDATALVGLHK